MTNYNQMKMPSYDYPQAYLLPALNSYDLNFEYLFTKLFPLLSVTNTTSYPFSEKCFIKLVAGNIWPPVPPAEKIIFLLISKIPSGIFSCKI